MNASHRNVAFAGDRAPIGWILACLLSCAVIVPCAHVQAQASKAGVTPFLQAMIGDWDVVQQMRSAPATAPIRLPAARAQRRLVDGAFLEERLTSIDAGPAFTRVADLVFNPVSRQYEYFSLDSRLPQMMAYASPGANRSDAAGLHFNGGVFVAPQWGDARNVPFLYRIDVGPVVGNRQQVRLFLRAADADGVEFPAFEYVYTRRQGKHDAGK